jgi:hypothetical protein
MGLLMLFLVRNQITGLFAGRRGYGSIDRAYHFQSESAARTHIRKRSRGPGYREPWAHEVEIVAFKLVEAGVIRA